MKKCLVMTALLTVLAGFASASPIDYFSYFNVYSLGDIGKANQKYGSDFQGVTGAGGNVYFSGFSLPGMGSPSGYSLHTGGSATLTGSYNLNLDIGGSVYLGGASVTGSIFSGGDVNNFGGGSVSGNVQAAGNVNLTNSVTVSGNKTSGAPYQPYLDLEAAAQQFLAASALAAAMENTTTASNLYGMLTVNGQSGLNIVTVDAATLKSAWGFTVNAPADAVVVINVTGNNVLLDSTNWSYQGGVSGGNVLLNYAEASALSLSGGNTVNLLAPLANVNFKSGVLTGTLIAGNLTGGGQVNLGHFTGGASIPEPTLLAMLGAGGLLILRKRR